MELGLDAWLGAEQTCASELIEHVWWFLPGVQDSIISVTYRAIRRWMILE